MLICFEPECSVCSVVLFLDTQDDPEAFKAYGVEQCVSMCKYLMEKGVKGFHFYVLNMENAALSVLQGLGWAESK